MIEKEIWTLKDRLNGLINAEADFSKIYELSVKLDTLIVKYYKNNRS